MKQYFQKRIEFVYPNEKGKTKIIGFNLIVEGDDKDNFDKFMNYLRSLTKANGLNELPIYDFEPDSKS